MTDKSETKTLPVTDPHQVKTVFVSQIVAQGYLNGVANFTLAEARFTPTPDNKIDPDLVIVARLRMDLSCVEQMRNICDAILKAHLKPANGTTH